MKARYNGLVNAIEFFSMRFEIDQLLCYAFDFTYELIAPDKMILWHLKDQKFVSDYKLGYAREFTFDYHSKYDQIVYFHAGLMQQKEIATLLPEDILQLYSPDFCIPLIMDKDFYGFIALQRNPDHPFTSEDQVLAVALMNLFSTALTSYSSYAKLAKTKSQLDEKIFNLFAMNQSTKALLSELSLKNLYDLSISVFSELTQSSFTAFFIKDEVSENYQLKSYQTVRFTDKKIDITLYESDTHDFNIPVVIDMSNEYVRNSFLSHFYNGQEIIEKINPIYIIALQKEGKLVGFVTLGEKVNTTKYDQSIFELVESLASATFIAINNAMHIEKISQQKVIINNKLTELIKLNNLMKNINSADTYNKVISLVMDTLDHTFGVEMGFFGLYNDDLQKFEITGRLNMEDSCQEIPVSDHLNLLFEGQPIIEYNSEMVDMILPNYLLIDTNLESTGVVLFPVHIKMIGIQLIGFIAILKNRSNLLITDENLVSFEAIATHVAPVIYQLQYAEKIKQIYQPDYSHLFIKQFEIDIREALEFSLELFVIHFSKKTSLSFETTYTEDISMFFKRIYPVDKQNILVLTNKEKELTALNELNSEDFIYNIYQLRNDFNSVDDFKKLFVH